MQKSASTKTGPKNMTYIRQILAAIILTTSLFIYNPGMINAKIAGPKLAEPVTYENIEYAASIIKTGYIDALDAKTGKKIREIKVYEINYDPGLEKDVQEKFISRLEMQNGMLTVYRDDGAKYSVNLSTGEVQVQKEMPLILWIIAGIVIAAIIMVILIKRR
jgi:hypothetical protein